MKILVVDDEDLLVKGIRFNLQNDGYEVITGSNGLEAIDQAKTYDPDLIILDVMMPEMDGLTACAKIREFSDVPIILLTAKADDMDKLMGFDQGADDYLTKPFNILELKARIRALLRRNTPAPVTTSGELEIDPAHMQVRRNGEIIPLTLTEYKVLNMLVSNRSIVTREQLLDVLWDDGAKFVDDNTLSVHISRLREKIGAQHIKTIRGVGYQWLA